MANQPVTPQQLIDAGVDAKTIEDAVNGAPEVEITSRLGRKFWTLATFDSRSQQLLGDFRDAVQTIVNDDGVPAEVVILGDSTLDVVSEQQDKFISQLKTPIQLSIDDTGTQDMTAKFAELMNPNGKYVVHLTKGTYLTDGFVVPENTIVYANGAVFKRRRYTGAPLIDVKKGGLIIGAIADGNKDALTITGGAVRDFGICLRDDATAIFCVSKNNYSHGFSARGESLATTSDNQKALFCKSLNNGFNASAEGTGTADGFNAANSHNFLFFGCESFDNARTNFVAETYNSNIPDAEKHDPTFSIGGKFKSCVAKNGGYSDFNAEKVTQVTFDDVTGKGLSFRGSPKTTIANSNLSRVYGAEDADFASISNLRIEQNEFSNEALFVTGKSPKVSNVNIVIGDNVTLTGTSITIQDTLGYLGEVSNISINRANNGMNLRVASATNLRVDTATGIKFFIGRNGGVANVTNFKQITDKKLEIYSSGLPTTGYWQKNDMVWNTFFSASQKTMGWVCTQTGTFGTGTLPVFEAITMMSKGVAVGKAVGTDDTSTKLNALIDSLKAGNILS